MYSVVIPTYGNKGVMLTQECLESMKILQHEREVIVVDDGSSEDDLEELTRICDIHGVALYHNEQNQGFAKTCNVGMQRANGVVVILLNNDVRMLGPSLDLLADAVQISNAGVMGIRLLYPNYTIQHAGQFFVPNGNYFDHYCRHEPRYAPQAIVFKSRLVSGACYAIHRRVIEAIGFFDENFSMAVEDVDYSLSCLELGAPVIYNGHIEALHLEGATRGNTPQTKSADHTMREQLGLQYLFEKWQGLDFKRFTREAQG